MKLSPRYSGSTSSIAVTVLALVVLVGAGMFFLGRRTKVVAQGSAPAADQAAQAKADGAEPAPAAKSGERRFAPHDTFFLLQYVSVKTPTGVIGFEPGQEVHLVEVKRDERKLVVGDGEAQVEVGPEQLTNDLDIAALVRQKDQANQAKVAEYLAAEKKAYDDAQNVAAEKAEKAADKINEKQQQVAAQTAAQEQAKIAANNAYHDAHTANDGDNSGRTSNSSAVGGGSKLDEPPVQVGGGTYGGYGYAGSSYYGSPYSYFGGSTGGTTSAPVSGGNAGAAANPASVGSAGRR